MAFGGSRFEDWPRDLEEVSCEIDAISLCRYLGASFDLSLVSLPAVRIAERGRDGLGSRRRGSASWIQMEIVLVGLTVAPTSRPGCSTPQERAKQLYIYFFLTGLVKGIPLRVLRQVLEAMAWKCGDS